MSFKNKFTTFLVTLFLLTLSLSLVINIYAESSDDLSKQLQEKSVQIQQYEGQLRQAQSQEKTLKSQLNIIDSQAKITQLKIEETNLKIEQLGRQINDLSGRIDRISSSVDTLSQILLDRIIKTYKYGNISTIDLLFSSAGFSDLLERLKYIQVVQANDKKVLYQLQATKAAYYDQKQDKETRQAQAEQLKKDLDVYQQQLTSQKAVKNQLLKATQNDEQKYQTLLAQARAEFLAIQGIVAGKGIETEVGPVSQGQKIATIINGPSCNSGGAHLHFTVVKDNLALNPFNYLRSIDNQNCSGSSCGSGDGDPFSPVGSWDWPISGPIQLNQGYGSTWAVRNTWVGRIYNFHNGLDIIGPSLEVRAVKAGILLRGTYTGEEGCSLPYVRVRHSEDGLDTLYLHVYY
ncbi:MAG: hypothetical protein HYW45_00820 [Candidatus Daviesbacteria bacterium]|nr:MAG: hypothetical protein HYW45_00820 [Candidatus Daviesbacteria bacterium]